MILQSWWGWVALAVEVCVWSPWWWQARQNPYLRPGWWFRVAPFAGPVAVVSDLVMGMSTHLWFVWVPVFTVFAVRDYRFWLRHKDDVDPRGGKRLRALRPVRSS